MFRTTVDAGHPLQSLAGRQNTKTKLGGNLHLIADTFYRFPDKNFIIERTIHFGRIQEGHAHVHRGMNRINRLRLLGAAVGETHSHTPETQCGKLELLFSEITCFHLIFLTC